MNNDQRPIKNAEIALVPAAKKVYRPAGRKRLDADGQLRSQQSLAARKELQAEQKKERISARQQRIQVKKEREAAAHVRRVQEDARREELQRLRNKISQGHAMTASIVPDVTAVRLNRNTVIQVKPGHCLNTAVENYQLETGR